MKRIEWQPERLADLHKHPHQHKYSHGHLLVLSGPRFHTGAARMAARAALRIGTGVVTLGAEMAAMGELASQLTEIMLRHIGSAQTLEAMLARDKRINALCLGPALGLDDRCAALVSAALESNRACVFDADALTLIGQNDGLRQLLHHGCVLTPHEGEFARLCPELDLGDAAETRARAVESASVQLGCTVLLKGSKTIVCTPGQEPTLLNSSETKSAPWLATAGAGDVLAGLVAGSLARGMTPRDAAETAALLHVEAAHLCGPGLIAGDLPEAIPQVLRNLGV